MTTTSYTSLEVEQLTTVANGFFIHELSSSLSHFKITRGDILLTLIGESSSKRACLLEGFEQEAFTPFFRLPVVFYSWVPSTPKEFAVVVDNKDLAIVWSVYVTQR